MAKRRRQPESTPSAPEALNNPFGALAKLRDALPAAPEAPIAVESASGVAAAGVVSATPGGKIVVRRETKGRGGKTVTRISGLGGELRLLAKKMKKALGCGASVEGGDLVLLGSLVARVADWLEAHGATRVVRAN
ncbi:MAG: translation initiation factor [Deltaproteobacteria bacterium]|nr:translation initiation factor [Deltaproteobacteria bacterium]